MQEATVQKEKQTQYRKIIGRIAKQSQLIFLGKVFSVMLGFATSALLARILGPTLLGRYQLGLTVILIGTIFSVAGFDKGLARFLPILQMKKNSEARSLFVFNVQITLAISIILAAVLYFAAPLLSVHYFHSEGMTWVIRAFSFYLPVISVSKIVSGAVIGIKRAEMNSHIGNVILPMVFLAALVLIYFSSGDLFGCIFARSITTLLGVAALVYFILKNIPIQEQAQERSVSFRRFISFSTSLMLIVLVYFLLGHMDIIMLGYFVDESQVGIYSVALKLAAFIIFGLEVVLPVVGPVFSELSERKSFKIIESLFKATTTWLLYSGLFLFGLVSILRVEVLNIFGSEYVIGGSILLILGIGNLANVISGPTGQLLVMTGKQRWEMANTILIVGLNFILNLFLIPKMGAIGAAIATALSVASINIAKLIEVYLLYGIHPYSSRNFKGIFAFLCGSLVCYFVRLAAHEAGMEYLSIIVIAGLSFTVVIFLGFWILGLDEEDKILFETLRSR